MSLRKLSDKDVQLIRYRRARGANQQDLAEEFSCAQSTICAIVTGRRYPRAGGPIMRPRMYSRRGH
jgi:DNA-binding XRE family transcriptional regulator